MMRMLLLLLDSDGERRTGTVTNKRYDRMLLSLLDCDGKRRTGTVSNKRYERILLTLLDGDGKTQVTDSRVMMTGALRHTLYLAIVASVVQNDALMNEMHVCM